VKGSSATTSFLHHNIFWFGPRGAGIRRLTVASRRGKASAENALLEITPFPKGERKKKKFPHGIELG